MQHFFSAFSAEIAIEIYWGNKGELDSYLIEITADILSRKDDEGQDNQSDYILDAAGNKGTGNDQPISSDLGAIVTDGVAFLLSPRLTYKEDSCVHARSLKPATFKFEETRQSWIEKIRQSLKIISYAQGFAQLRVASKKK